MHSETSDADAYERKRDEVNERQSAADHEASEQRRKRSRKAYDEQRKHENVLIDSSLHREQLLSGHTSEEDY